MTRLLLVLAIAAISARPTLGQRAADPLARGLDLERRGNFAEAVTAYRAALAVRPGDPSALLGLERALQPLNRTGEVLEPARAALRASPSAAVYGVLVRAFAGAGMMDSARVIVDQWAKVAPRDDAPYREWGLAALQRRDRQTARGAFELARSRLGRGDAMASEMAQILVTEGRWDAAAGEWLLAARQLPGYLLTAVASLSPTPERARAGVISALSGDKTLEARRLQAALMARWGTPEAGVRQLIAALPADRVKAGEALNQFADFARTLGTPAGAKARGQALEEMSERVTGLAASRARLEAARAYQEAGDREAARRMLGTIASDTASGAASLSAAATLIGVLVEDGKVADAERRLASARAGLTTDEYQALNRRVALGWIRVGDLDRAERVVRTDSTVEGLALAGRIAIFRGDLIGGVSRLQLAGPYAGTREEATERAALLALLQPIAADTVRELGAALLLLERRDTVGAATALERIAASLPADAGAAGLRLLSGRLFRQAGRTRDAERLFRDAATEAAPATAPAAELELARLLLSLRRAADAIPVLEHLILTYPTSALVPQARRALEEAKGAVPRT